MSLKIPKKLKKNLTLAFTTLAVGAAFTFLAFILNIFGKWDLNFADFLYQTSNRTSPEIVLVTIDDETLDYFGRWQDLTRSDMAQVIETIMADKAAVLGIDINFTQVSTDQHDNALEETLKGYKNIVMVNEYDHKRKAYIAPLTRFSDHTSIGYANIEVDSDGTVRRLPLFRDNPLVYSFTTEILRTYLGLRPRDLVPANHQLTISTKPVRPPSNPKQKLPPLTLPFNEDKTFTVNYFGQPHSFPAVSFAQIYKGEVPAGTFNKKIILLGATSYSLHDSHLTPVSKGKANQKAIEMPGVEIHANILQTMLSRQFITYAPASTAHATAAGFILLITLLVTFLKFRYTLLISLTLAALYIIITWGAFAFGIILSLAYPLFALIITTAAGLITRYTIESRDKRFLKDTFSRYLSPALVDKILHDPSLVKLGGEKRNLAVMFSDLGNFTSFSETLSPEKLVEFMNKYHSVMTDLVLEEEGTLDKYEGDAIMAFWGAPLEIPEPNLHACRAVYRNREAFKAFKKKTGKEAKDVTLRIGLHTGEMIVGNMGSERRFDYTVMGDNVNLAARLEGVNKLYGTQICVSEEIYQSAKKEFLFRELDLIRVKGKKKPVRIYELITPLTERTETTPDYTLFEKALGHYRHQKWDEATKLFHTFLEQAPGDLPTQVFLKRIDAFKTIPPVKEWDGVYEMKTK